MSRCWRHLTAIITLLVRNTVGAGSALYCGSVFTADTATAIINLLGITSPANDWLSLPPFILSVRVHEATGDQLSFVLNYSNVAQNITLHKAATELIADRQIEGTAEIPPYGVFILATPQEPSARQSPA